MRYKLLLIITVLVFRFQSNAQNNKPNIVVIFVDDLGYADLSCYGATAFKTPHLDAMAKQGMRFTDFYVGASVCSPSRAALLTGKYPIATKMHKGVLFPFSKGGLDPKAVTLAEVLKYNGYNTGCIGKWHLGHSTSDFMPNNQGFDYFYGIPYSNDMDARKYPKQNYQAPPLPLYKNDTIIEEGIDQRFFTKRFTNESIAFIERNVNTPFFLYVAHPMPHTPVHVSPDFMHSSKYGRYGDVIQELDWGVGAILKTLKSLNILDNTIVLFTSDNGPDQGFWMGKNHGKATPLKGAKGTTWEGGFRVPFIALWPDNILENSVTNEMITAIDIMPTIIKWTESELPKAMTFDGRNRSTSFFGKSNNAKDDDTFFYYATNGRIEAVRNGKWKLHIAKTKGWDKAKGKFKSCLFNVVKDKREAFDVSNDYSEKVEELKRLIIEKNRMDLL